MSAKRSMPASMVAEMSALHLTGNQMRQAWNDYDAHFQEGHEAGVALERSRVESILTSPLAKMHPAMAEKLAFHTEVDSTAALTLLGSMPVPAPKAEHKLDKAIRLYGQPNVGTEHDAEGEETVAATANRIASYSNP